MKRNIIFILLSRLFKIYFSNCSNKTVEYKKALFYTLEEYGGVYIKFLQVLSVMNKFMNDWATPHEYEVFNRVQEEYIDLKKIIKNKEQFLKISDVPIATGSFAQVYKGNLKTGEEVAIKVLRPSVYKNLKNDLKYLKKVVKIANRFVSIDIVDLNKAYIEFSNTCLDETNYLKEMSNMEYFYDKYKNHNYIVIPKLYKNLSSKRVIVQEYIDGITLADVLTDKISFENIKELNGSNIFKQLTIVGGEILNMTITSDFVYADPHPGNIILQSNNKIAFIDFGIISRKPISQEAFYLWMKSYYDILIGNANCENFLRYTLMCFCPDIINALSKCELDNFIKTISNAIQDKLNKIIDNDEEALNYLNNGHLFKIFSEYLNTDNALNFKVDMRNFQLIKAMQAFLCSITTIDNKFGNNDFSNIMKDCIEYSLNYVEKIGIKKDYDYKTKYNIGECYEIILEILTSLANKDELLFETLTERM